MNIICGILFIIVIVETGILAWFTHKNQNERTIDDIIEFFRRFWGKFVFYVLATSIIGLFLGSVYFEKVIGLNEINSWVSIVLGLVALIIGIISLYLSFYNVDQSTRAQDKNLELMNGIKGDITKKLYEIQMSMNDNFSDLKHGKGFEGLGQNNTMKTVVNENGEWRKIDE